MYMFYHLSSVSWFYKQRKIGIPLFCNIIMGYSYVGGGLILHGRVSLMILFFIEIIEIKKLNHTR